MSVTAPAGSIHSLGTRLGPLIEQHIETAFRMALTGEGAHRDDRHVRLITGAPHPFGNFAMMSNPADLDAAADAMKPLCACGAPAAILFAGTIMADMDGLVRENGFHAHDPMPAMAVEINRLPELSLPSGYTFRRVGSGADGVEWARAFAVGYELPHEVGEAFSPAALGVTLDDDAPMQFFAIEHNGQHVATSMLLLHDGLAGIYCVSTVPDHRCKGLGAFATAEALRAANRVGYRVGVLQSSPAGYPVYQRLGFSDHGAVTLYVRM